jgi:hypothetical protein
MANAIPVNMDPEAAAQANPASKRGVKVQASPSLDENGVVTQGEYAAKQREGLGDAADFSDGTATQVTTPITVAEVDAAGKVVGERVHSHQATRVDH